MGEYELDREPAAFIGWALTEGELEADIPFHFPV